MKSLRNMIMNTCCTFSVLSILFGILCCFGVFENLPYTQVVFTLLLMSAGTSAVIVLRETLLPNMERLKYAVEIAGCAVVILLCLRFSGWLELRVSYFLLVLGMIVMVYLVVWFLTWLQSKRDEGDLNELLRKRKDS